MTEDAKQERKAHECPSCDLSPPLGYKHKVLRRIELRQPQTDAKKAALLPCPFCGNPPKSGDNTYGYWLIFCSDENNCSAQPVVGHKTEAEAIAGWNTRQPQTDDNEDFGDTVLDFGVELLFAVIGLETQPYGTNAVFEVELRGRTRKVTVT